MVVRPTNSMAAHLPPAEHIFSEVPVDANVTSNSRATPDELVELADGIWKRVKASPKGDKEADELLKQLQNEHRDFATSFPLVLRWMVQMRRYRSAVFRQYLTQKFARARPNSREDFLRLQAEYLVMMYRADNKHPAENAVRDYRERTVKQLLDEDAEFTRLTKEVEEEFDRKGVEYDQARRQALYSYLLRQKTEQAAGGPSTVAHATVAPATVAPATVAPATIAPAKPVTPTSDAEYEFVSKPVTEPTEPGPTSPGSSA